MKRYYTLPKDAAGQIITITDRPVDMTNVIVTDLPDGDWFNVAGKGDKEYPAYKVATAIAYDQIAIETIIAVD